MMSWILYVLLILSKYMFHKQYLEFANLNTDFSLHGTWMIIKILPSFYFAIH